MIRKQAILTSSLVLVLMASSLGGMNVSAEEGADAFVQAEEHVGG